MRFASPALLLLLTVPLGYAALAWVRRRRVPPAHIGFPAPPFLQDARPSRPGRWQPLLAVLRVSGLALLIVALARPQVPTRYGRSGASRGTS